MGSSHSLASPSAPSLKRTAGGQQPRCGSSGAPRRLPAWGTSMEPAAMCRLRSSIPAAVASFTTAVLARPPASASADAAGNKPSTRTTLGSLAPPGYWAVSTTRQPIPPKPVRPRPTCPQLFTARTRASASELACCQPQCLSLLTANAFGPRLARYL